MDNQPEATVAEFASIVMTVDHLTQINDGHTRLKGVMSTESDVETLLSLFKYYGQEGLALSPRTVELFQEAGRNPAHIWVFRVRNDLLQLVLSVETMGLLVAHPDFGNGSNLQAVDRLMHFVATAEADILNQSAGRYAPLFLITPSLEDPIVTASSEGEEDPTRGVAREILEGATQDAR